MLAGLAGDPHAAQELRDSFACLLCPRSDELTEARLARWFAAAAAADPVAAA